MKWISRDPLKREVDPRDHDLLDDVVDRILDKVTATSDYEIELQIHDLLLKNVEYVDKKKTTEHTIEGPLLNKKAVCEGIAKTMKYLLNKKGVQCEMVLGKLKEDLETYHAWNVVNVDGDWYHVDVTADIGISSGISFRRDYLNLSDEEISTDHMILRSPVECLVPRNCYYYRSGLVIKTQKEFKHRLIDMLAHGENELTFKLPSSKDPKRVSDLIVNNITEVMGSTTHRFRRYQLTPNVTQLVFTIRFS